MTDRVDPAGALVGLATALEAGRPPSRAAAKAFSDAVRQWLDGADLETALGLGGRPGVERARTLYRRAQRNEHLRAAHQLVEGSTPWCRSVTLAAEIDRFLAVIWPRWGHLDEPPVEASQLRTELFRARKMGHLPESPRALHRIATASGPFDAGSTHQ